MDQCKHNQYWKKHSTSVLFLMTNLAMHGSITYNQKINSNKLSKNSKLWWKSNMESPSKFFDLIEGGNSSLRSSFNFSKTMELFMSEPYLIPHNRMVLLSDLIKQLLVVQSLCYTPLDFPMASGLKQFNQPHMFTTDLHLELSIGSPLMK